MHKDARNVPTSSRPPLLQAVRTLKPLFRQLCLSGYIFAMQLPAPLVHFFLVGGNNSLMKAVHKGSHGKAKLTPGDAAESMASSMGPSLAESKTQTPNGDSYPRTIKYSREFANVMNMAGYYRDGAGLSRWNKSLETVTALHRLAAGNELRRTSSGTGLFDEAAPGVMKASSTVLWGKLDIALEPTICLDGMADYLVGDSQIVLLPRSGHFTPIEVESRAALKSAVEWAVQGEKEDIGVAVQRTYEDARVIVRR
jgi:pimeloyl-ACP methyl ester carboxylesterase